jgi:hypothetical protein
VHLVEYVEAYDEVPSSVQQIWMPVASRPDRPSYWKAKQTYATRGNNLLWVEPN